MKKCNNCGYILKDDQIFCNKCGTKWVDLEAIRKAEEEKARLDKEERERLIAEREAIRKVEQEAAQEKARLKKEERKRKIAEREVKNKIIKENIRNADILDITKKVLIKLFITFRWVCTAFFAILALVIFSDSSIISGLSIVVVTYFACPLNNKFDDTLKIKPGVKLLIAIIFFIIAIYT